MCREILHVWRVLWFKSNPHQEGRICPVLQRRLVAELEMIHHLWASALPVGWGAFLGADVEIEKEHAVSSLALSVPVWSPIFRAERSTFPAAQPPLLFFAPSTQQMHSALSWAASNLSLHLLLLFLSAADSAWCAGGNCPFPGAVQSQAHRSYCTSQKFFWKEIQPFASIIPLLQAADNLTF